MENKDFENIIKNILKESHNQGKINEDFGEDFGMDDDEDDNLGMFSGDFNPEEFKGPAMKAAKQDIGSDFEPLGQSKFEKNLDQDEFISDLQRQNLNLKSDKAERNKLKAAIDKKKKHEKMFGAGSMNEEQDEMELPQGDHPDGFSFDMKSVYHYFKDALHQLKRYEPEVAAEIIEKALKRDFGFTGKGLNEISPYVENPKVNKTSKISRPNDAEGQPLTLNARVEHLGTNAAGRIKRFGVNKLGQLVVDVNWVTSPAPTENVLPTEIVVRDTNRDVRENEIEEGMGHSYTIGKGTNLKPSNYPETLEREGLNENLDSVQPQQGTAKTFLVIDDAFNRAHYPDLIGQTFDNPPSDAKVKQINPEDVEAEAAIKYDLSEDIEQKQTLIGKEIEIKNINSLQEMLFPNNKRIKTILDSINEEISNDRVNNNTISATDNMDTSWLFNINKVTDNTVELQLIGTTK